MKWGKASDKAVERVNKFIVKLATSKGFYVLLALAALLLLSSANDKWGQ